MITDDQRIADALRYYIERCNWTKDSPERVEYHRLLDHYGTLAGETLYVPKGHNEGEET